MFLNEPCLSVPECGHEQDTLHLDKPWKFTFSRLGKACGKRGACVYKPFVVSLLCIGLKCLEDLILLLDLCRRISELVGEMVLVAISGAVHGL